MDWHEWYQAYDDPDSALSRRLAIVRSEISLALDRLPKRPWTVLSMCSGDGRDLFGPLAEHRRRRDVSGRLVELDPDLAARAAQAYAAAGLDSVDIITGDAGDPANYGGLTADLLLVCGVFGNVSDDGVLQLATKLPSLCRQGATLIWTRHQVPPDLTPAIRSTLDKAGFRELGFHPVDRSRGAVGVHRYAGGPAPAVDPNEPLFTFSTDASQRWQQPSG
jgi:hypothetical protein